MFNFAEGDATLDAINHKKTSIRWRFYIFSKKMPERIRHF